MSWSSSGFRVRLDTVEAEEDPRGEIIHCGTGTSSGTLVAVICCCAVIFDGYDLSAFATTIPALLEYEAWDLDPAQTVLIASYAFMGMLVGTLICGLATDLLGRRRMLMATMIPAAIGIGLVLLLPLRHLDGRPLGTARESATVRGGSA